MQLPLFQVLKKGLLTTFQDKGRYGYQQFGVVTGGAMDVDSLRIANLLVGNQIDEVCLEISMLGPTLQVLADEVVISICGANLSPSINNQPMPLWQSVRVYKNDIIKFGKPKHGIRSYLAVSGGFFVEEVLGSKSFYQKADLGTSIEEGDQLMGFPSTKKKRMKGIAHSTQPQYEKDITVRVIVGPHENEFSTESIEHFFKEPYKVMQADRMGYRLNSNTKLEHKNKADIASDAIPIGGIQVPSNGQPIILMADRQTTGGYTRIGTVITADIPKIAQVPPGGSIRFEKCTIEQAHSAYQEREKFIRILQKLRRD
ncbi:biotin-dependent carboxyltransferase [Bacillus luteolus]|uniref:Biotin-dependent carboxyltransferase n=1 Tax=Litchfieldia luteola TaxID=682179 RepID=A0ABR9QGT6_9BACI|nr:biotin-dependent carboxyltransferase family protein [Cytobacillus luteolus]MBE4907706.1 biotin-dependent carboxyltransferase [Cytobacillus luteolus]MBP1944054.1 antagonist of KipI [Cytobacillus luteolus]